MKAIIENPVKVLFLQEAYEEALLEFNLILTRICNAENSDQLRSSMNLDRFRHYKFGFGGGHMWVKQVINGQPKQQVIFVQF